MRVSRTVLINRSSYNTQIVNFCPHTLCPDAFFDVTHSWRYKISCTPLGLEPSPGGGMIRFRRIAGGVGGAPPVIKSKVKTGIPHWSAAVLLLRVI
jgi:hypothetical protein